MNLFAIIRQALRTLLRNKLRSTLTVLGVMIGIGAVICVVGIGNAGSMQIQEQLKNLGDNMIWVEAGSRAPNGVRSGSRGTKTLVVGDATAIAREAKMIKAVSPNIDGRVQVIYGNSNWYTSYRGVSPEYLDIRRWTIQQGSSFTNDDVERSADVCLIGQTIKDQLFANEDPIGKTMRVKDLPCKVVGVLYPKGQSSFGQDQDDTVLLPYTTVQKKIAGQAWLDDILCSAVSAEALKPATAQIVEMMRDRHRIRAGMDDDFNIRSPEDFINMQLEASRTFTWLLVSIAAVSLLVGGIGIMNVMLVSVTERTREIGIRMAIGATEGSVQMQFLGEAVILSLFGGCLGVLAGVGGSIVISNMLRWPVQIPPQAILVATAFSVAVGMFFGYYPARKASRLDPIEALRFE